MRFILTNILVTLCSLTAFAQRPPPPLRPALGGGQASQVIESARRLSYLANDRAYALNPQELNQITRLLQDAESLLLNAGQIGQPSGSVCKLQGYGGYRSYNWNYLLTLNGATIDASNELPDALGKLSALQSSGVCSRPYTTTDICEISGYAGYRSYNWSYIIKVNGVTVDASNDFGETKSKLQSLNMAMVCRNVPKQACSLQGYGGYRSYNWNFRISIGTEVVDASNDAGEATSRLNELKQMGLCY